MNRQNVEKNFFRYVFPSMLTLFFMSFYAIVDGFFIGQVIGDVGLAANNIAWPVAALFIALSKGIGVGGSVLMSIRTGADDREGALVAKGNVIFMLIVASIVVSLGFYFATPLLMRAFGASGETYEKAVEYAQVISLFGWFQILSGGLTSIMKNSDKVISSMVYMIIGFVSNIILDAMFVWVYGWGMQGAALATVLGQAVVALLCSISILRDKKFKISLHHLKPDRLTITEAVKIGLSPFGLSMVPSIIIIFTNWQCIRYAEGGAEFALAAYSIIAYISNPVQMLIQGVGEGAQPLMSFCMGAKMYDTLARIKRKAIISTLGVSFVLMAGVIICKDGIADMFGASETTAGMVSYGVTVLAFSFPFMGISKMASSYFYALDIPRYSSILVYADPIVISPLLLIVLPLIFGLKGVWLTLPLVQVFLCALAIYFWKAKSPKFQHKTI